MKRTNLANMKKAVFLCGFICCVVLSSCDCNPEVSVLHIQNDSDSEMSFAVSRFYPDTIFKYGYYTTLKPHTSGSIVVNADSPKQFYWYCDTVQVFAYDASKFEESVEEWRQSGERIKYDTWTYKRFVIPKKDLEENGYSFVYR